MFIPESVTTLGSILPFKSGFIYKVERATPHPDWTSGWNNNNTIQYGSTP